LVGWGDPLIPRFELAIFIVTEPGLRLARLRERERRRYGNAIADGGAMHDAHVAFVEWATAYDTGGVEIRSLRLHREWLRALPCPVLELNGGMLPDLLVEVVERFIGHERFETPN
jgi:hypothetical protein